MPLSDEERERIEEEVELRVRTEIRVRKRLEMEERRAKVARIDDLGKLSWRRVPSYFTIKRLGETVSAASRSSLALTVLLVFGLGLVVSLIAVLALLAAISVGLVWITARLF